MEHKIIPKKKKVLVRKKAGKRGHSTVNKFSKRGNSKEEALL